jgi:hypothetical protein
MGFAYGFLSVWVLRMSFHLYGFSSVWIFICMGFAYGFSSVWVLRMNFHLWIFICEGFFLRSMRAKYASEAFF